MLERPLSHYWTSPLRVTWYSPYLVAGRLVGGGIYSLQGDGRALGKPQGKAMQRVSEEDVEGGSGKLFSDARSFAWWEYQIWRL